MNQDRNVLAPLCLAAALVGVAVVTAAVGQTTPTAPAGASVSASPTVPITKLDNPQKLASAGVLDSTGKPIGKIADVKTGSDGKATRVKIALMTQAGMGRVATVKADSLKFDQTKGVVLADLSPAEVDQLASTASTMGPGASAQSQAPSGSQGSGK